MPDRPGQPYRRVASGVALAGAGVIAATPATAARPDVQVFAIQLAATDPTDIVIDIVRHAEDLAPADSRIPFSPEFPGAPLSDLGKLQAQDTANQLFGELGGPHGIAGLFSGPDLDAQGTAAPFATLEEMTPQILSGLVEVDGGVYANLPIVSPGGILYDLAVVAWPLGLVTFFPIPGALDFNGVVTDDKYTHEVDAMYAEATANPVVSDNGQITDVAFSSEAATMTWVLNTVKNPDISLLLSVLLKGLANPGGGLPEPLPNASVVEITGNPEDGWTLVSWAGQPAPQNPGLGDELFTLWRDLVLPPQTAAFHLYQALLTGDPTTIGDAFHDGVHDIGAALGQVPELVTDALRDIATANW